MNVSEKPGWKRRMAILITRSGDGLILVSVLALVVIAAPPDWKRWALLVGLVDLINLAVTSLLKSIYKRRRPPGQWGQDYRRADPYSFPSGHSSRGGSAGMAMLLLGPVGLGIAGLVWGALIALSRVWTGVHYLVDALAGYALGMVIGTAVIVMLT